jgi:hypothetical protein
MQEQAMSTAETRQTRRTTRNTLQDAETGDEHRRDTTDAEDHQEHTSEYRGPDRLQPELWLGPILPIRSSCQLSGNFFNRKTG